MRYAHPILWRGEKTSMRSGIGMMSKDGTPVDPEEFWELQGGSNLGEMKIHDDLDRFFRELRADTEYRRSLGIPDANYVAFSYAMFGYGKIPSIIALIQKGRELGYECRGWCNEESAMLVVCFVSFDMSEDCGWDMYEWANVKENAPSDSYGHAHWHEFCFLGVPIYDTWTLEDRNNHLVAIAPDDSKFAFFG